MGARHRRAKDKRHRRQRAAVLSGGLALGFAAPAGAATFTAAPLKNINTVESGGAPGDVIRVGAVAYYSASDGVAGRELWVTDGTAAGTNLVKDIQPGGNGSYPTELTNVGGTLFFVANDGSNGDALWKTDGTAAGTVIVKDVRAGDYSPYLSSLVNFNGTLLFAANDGTNGTELWKSNGTGAGTALVKDIDAGPSSSGPSNLTVVDSVAFLTADDGTSGVELFQTDGTAAGTGLVKDIAPGSSPGGPSGLTNINGALFFRANNATDGVELWTSDGTTAGTLQVKDIYPGSTGSSPNAITNVGGVAYFSANDGTDGYELWKSNGTTAGTTEVKNLNGTHDGTPFGKYSSAAITNIGGTIYFVGDNGTDGAELWKSNGTAAGTVQVKDIQPGTGSGAYLGKYDAVSPLVNVGGTVYFYANDGTTGSELWKSNGSAAGTVQVKDARPGPTSGLDNAKYRTTLTNFAGALLFAANDGATGTELWKSDGSAGGTALIKNLDTSDNNSVKYEESKPAAVGNTVFFPADDGTTGIELWKTDGTVGGTTLVKDIWPGNKTPDVPNGGYPYGLTNVNGTAFFTANDGTHGTELWKTDGTDGGTVLVKDIHPGIEQSGVSRLINVAGTLFFSADDGTNGGALWKSDGTDGGTVMVKDLDPSTSAYLSQFTVVGNVLYFAGNDGTNGTELWRSDGTTGGTTMVKDINPAGASSGPRSMINVAGTLFFSAVSATDGRELWKSDGTDAGTVEVKNINGDGTASLADDYQPTRVAAIGSTVFFVAHEPTGGIEVWKSDGTDVGTTRLKDIFPGVGDASPGNFEVVGGTLYFTANDGTTGFELWRSDGTDAGTAQVADLRSGAQPSEPYYLTNAAGTLLFAANDGTTGPELWEAGATGASRVSDIWPGTAGGRPAALTVVGRNLFFDADDSRTGVEPWLATAPPIAVTPTPTPTVTPTPTPTAKRKPKLVVKVRPRRDKTKPFKFAISGTLKRPAGVSKAQACSGKFSVVARKRKVKKPLFARTVKLSKRCTFTLKKKAKLGRRAGKRGKATFTVTYKGNTYLKKATKRVVVRYGAKPR